MQKRDRVDFHLLGPVQAGMRPKVMRFKNGQSHTYTPDAHTTYLLKVRAVAAAAHGDRPQLEGPLKLSVMVVLAEPKLSKAKLAALAGFKITRPDLDNYVKIVSDALGGVLCKDDGQIAVLEASKVFGPRPGLWVRLERLTPAAMAALEKDHEHEEGDAGADDL